MHRLDQLMRQLDAEQATTNHPGTLAPEDRLDRLTREYEETRRPANTAARRPHRHMDGTARRDASGRPTDLPQCHIVINGRRCPNQLPSKGMALICVEHLVDAASYLQSRDTLEGSTQWRTDER